MNRYRFSEIKTFMTCPKMYESEYILGNKRESEEMKLGRDVETAFQSILEGLVPPIGGTVSQMASNAIEALLTVVNPKGCKIHSQARFVSVIDSPIVGQFELQTTPDFIFEFQDEIVLIDLKTCSKYSSWAQKRAAEDLQLNLYSAIVSKFYEKPVKSFYCVVNKTDYRARCLPSNMNFDAAISIVENIVVEIEAAKKNKMFTPKQSMLCGKWCDVCGNESK